MKKETHIFYNNGWNKQLGMDRIEPEMMDNLLSEDRVIYDITCNIILSKLDPHCNEQYDYAYNQLLNFRIVTRHTEWEHIRDKELLKLFHK